MPELSGRAGRGRRDKDDYYATTPDTAMLCCKTLRTDFIANPGTILDPNSILEPTCGAGTWLPGIRETWPNADILGVERHPDLADFSRKRGFNVKQKDIFQAELGTYDLIVGNPPFKYADQLIPMLLTRLNKGGVLAFLLRLGFLEGQERYEKFWRIYPSSAIYPFPARPGFTADGATDGTAYGMMCWKQGHQGFTVLRHLDNRLTTFKWEGTPAVKRKKKVIRPAVRDPNFPDPRMSLPLVQRKLTIKRRI